MSRPSLFLHVGLMKTGTTYLQNVLRENSADLLMQGVYYPAGRDAPNQRHAVWDLVGRRSRGSRDDRIVGQWRALTEAVARQAASTVVLSEEYLASVTGRQARRAVAAFPRHDVHVLITARDLGRVLSSAWQEEVKNGATRTWADYLAAVRDPRQRGQDPARSFWLRHDLPSVVDTWAGAVGAERVHVVTVPPPGSSREVLLARVGGVVGFDPSRLKDTSTRANESLGAPATEVLRRVNERLDGRLNERQYDKVVKVSLQRRLAGTTRVQPLPLPPEAVAWATAETQRMIDHLSAGGYDVAGALDELLLEPGDVGRRSDAMGNQETSGDPAGTLQGRTDTTDTQDVRTDTADPQDIHTDTTDTQDIHTDTAGTQDIHTDTTDTQDIHTDTAGTQDIHTDTAGTQDVRAEELLEASIDAMAALAEEYAATWWRLRRADVARVPPKSPAVRASSAIRGAGFRVRRAGADLADRNRVGAAAMRVYLRLRR